MANDTALDWVAARAEAPLAAAIEVALRGYLEGKTRPAEAEAAVALLVIHSGPHEGTKYRAIDLRHEAAERGLWDLAVKVIGELKNDAAWISSWLEPQTKLSVLDELSEDVGRLAAECHDEAVFNRSDGPVQSAPYSADPHRRRRPTTSGMSNLNPGDPIESLAGL
jgi:hypothetical protein